MYKKVQKDSYNAYEYNVNRNQENYDWRIWDELWVKNKDQDKLIRKDWS